MKPKKRVRRHVNPYAARSYEQPVFKFKEHKTPEAILQRWVQPSGWKLKDITFGGGGPKGPETSSGAEMVAALKQSGMWGFADTRAKPKTIHFWHDGKRSERELTHFFGHEMGHCVGKPEKNGWPEENRADDYGYVAMLAVEAARKAQSR